MKKIMKLSLLFIFFSNISIAQETGYDKKVAKSPAKDLILKCDRIIARVNDVYSRMNSEPENLFERCILDELVLGYDSLNLLKDEITKLDSKWNVKNIQTCLTENAVDHEKSKTFYLKKIEDRKLFYEYDVFFTEIEKKIKSLNGKDLYNYVSGTDDQSLNWEKLKETIEKAKPYVENFKIPSTDEYGRKSLKEYYIPAYNYLDFSGNNSGSLCYDRTSYYGFSKAYGNIRWPIKNEDLDEDVQKYAEYEQEYYQLKAYNFMFPQSEKIKVAYDEISYNMDLLNEYVSKFTVSQFHKDNIGKIFFSDHKITFGKETAADFKTKFKAGEDIYVIQYLTEESGMYNNSLFEINEKLADENELLAKINPFPMDDGLNKPDKMSVFQFLLTPKSDSKVNLKDKIEVYRALYQLSKLEEGTHTILFNTYAPGVYELEIEFPKSNPYVASYEHVKSEFKKTVPIPKAGMTDPSVHDWVVRSLKNSEDEELKNITFLRTIIISNEWSIEINRYSGGVSSRSADIAILCKDANGECFMFVSSYDQEKAGANFVLPDLTFQPGINKDDVFYKGDYYDRIYVDCSRF